MKKKIPVSILAIVIVLTGCKKNMNLVDLPDPGPDAGAIPLVTSIGTPVGDPVSKNIGAAGGILISPDGKLEVNIPAGALSTNTDISIQPVMNTVPGGAGLSYDLLPNGTKFSKPATLTFHYTKEDVMGNDPIFLCIAYQDNSNKWITNLEQQNLDSTAKTLSLGVSHFTIYSTIDLGVLIQAAPEKLGPNKTSQIRAWENLSGDGTLSYLAQIPAGYISHWKVNGVEGGNNTDGTIEGSGSLVTYRAPAQIPTKRDVNITVHVKVNLTVFYRGQKLNFPNGVDIGTNITLQPDKAEYNFKISIAVIDSSISPFYPGPAPNQPVYRDNATFNLKINLFNGGLTYDTSNLHNEAPTVTPTTSSYQGTEFIWLIDPYGVINVESIRASAITVPQDSVIEFSVLHSKANFWGYITQSSTDGTLFTRADPVPYGGTLGIPQFFNVDLKRKDAYFDPSQGQGKLGEHVYVAIVPQ